MRFTMSSKLAGESGLTLKSLGFFSSFCGVRWGGWGGDVCFLMVGCVIALPLFVMCSPQTGDHKDHGAAH